MASKSAKPVPAHKYTFAEVVSSYRHWWHNSVVKTVDQADVIERRREECLLSARYLFMLSMSAGIAVLGLLLSSPAVVIGAMLLSPLMGPIIGLGFALATGDYAWMRQAGVSLAAGTALAILFCALIVWLSPLQTVTSEIAARTRPNLFDLGIAFFSALAGAYAMIRGQLGAVVGVAIATALMPPLAVIGFGLATWNGAVFWGAFGLFVTNLLTIALTAWVMARLYGFHSTLSERQTIFQSVAIAAVFVAMAVPLGLSLNKIVWETRSTQKIRSDVKDVFDSRSVVSNIDINWDSDPIQISATVFTPELKSDADATAKRTIARDIDRAVDVTLVQSRVGPDKSAAEAAQLAAARAQQEQAATQRAEELAARLALVAGVKPEDVTIDREHRRALVTAQPLAGAGLGAYRELEARIAATEPQWQVRIKPPARPLPEVELKDGKPTPDGSDAIALIAWAVARIGAPVVLEGRPEETKAIADLFGQRGVATSSVTNWRHRGTVAVRWGAPGG